MGILNILFNKKKKNKNSHQVLPPGLRKFIDTHITINKDVMLLDTGRRLDGSIGEYISLIIKEEDLAVKLIGKDPIIESMPLIVNFRYEGTEIYYLFYLMKINGNDNLLYEMNFDLSLEKVRHVLETFSSQPVQQIVVVGDTQETAIKIDLTPTCVQIKAAIQFISGKSNFQWNHHLYSSYLPIIFNKFPKAEDLWKIFHEHGMIVDLHLKTPETI